MPEISLPLLRGDAPMSVAFEALDHFGTAAVVLSDDPERSLIFSGTVLRCANEGFELLRDIPESDRIHLATGESGQFRQAFQKFLTPLRHEFQVPPEYRLIGSIGNVARIDVYNMNIAFALGQPDRFECSRFPIKHTFPPPFDVHKGDRCKHCIDDFEYPAGTVISSRR